MYNKYVKGVTILLQFLFFLLFFLIFFILLITALPYYYKLSLNYDQNIKLQFWLSILFLQVKIDILDEDNEFQIQIFNYQKIFKTKKISSEENKAAKFIQEKGKKFFENKFNKDNKEKTNEDKKKFKFPFHIITRENLNHIFSLLIKIIKELKPDFLKLNLQFSFPDPYYNGLFLAYYYTFKELTNYPDLKAEINWQEVMFKVKTSLGGKIIPLKLFLILLNFIFSGKSFKIFWQIYKSN